MRVSAPVTVVLCEPPTLTLRLPLTLTVCVFSAWTYSSSEPFLSSKRISLKFESWPSSVLRVLMPDWVLFSGSV